MSSPPLLSPSIHERRLAGFKYGIIFFYFSYIGSLNIYKFSLRFWKFSVNYRNRYTYIELIRYIKNRNSFFEYWESFVIGHKNVMVSQSLTPDNVICDRYSRSSCRVYMLLIIFNLKSTDLTSFRFVVYTSYALSCMLAHTLLPIR